uniref:Uncharacterized protein n=1 Tax=Aquila chrysaetos chrysaetos TaxID=223781 RepID=A0A663E7V6_AQUCH
CSECGKFQDLATDCWLSSLTQWWVTSAGKSHVSSLLQRAGTSARSDFTFNLSTAQNDHCQQRPELKSALSSQNLLEPQKETTVRGSVKGKLD